MLAFDLWSEMMLRRHWDQHRQQRRSFGLRVIADVQNEPIRMEEAWWHLRVDDGGGPNDDWIEQIGIPAARTWCEQYTGLSIAKRTLEMSADRFDAEIEIPFGPVDSLVSVTYTDPQGVSQVAVPAAYELDPYSSPNVLRPAYGTSWPVARGSANSVLIRYVVGYSVLGDNPMVNPLPGTMRAALLMMLAHLFENREATAITRATDVQEMPLGVKSLLDFHRVRLGMA